MTAANGTAGVGASLARAGVHPTLSVGGSGTRGAEGQSHHRVSLIAG